MSDWGMDPYEVDPWQDDPNQYTNNPNEQQAMLEWLMMMSKPELAQARSVLTGVGTDLTNQGKVLGIENKMLDNQGDLMKLAMNPMVGQLSGAFDPMAMAAQPMMGGGYGGGFGGGGGMQQPQMPFEMSGFSPLRSQWQTSQTPAAQAVLAMFDQIDAGQDPYTLINEYTSATGGALDVPHPSLGITGKEMLKHAQDYWNEKQQSQTAQAQFQFESAQMPQQIPGMEGVDPTLGSFSEEMVMPGIGETLVGNQIQAQDSDPIAAQAQLNFLKDQRNNIGVGAPSTPRLEDMTPEQRAEIMSGGQPAAQEGGFVDPFGPGGQGLIGGRNSLAGQLGSAVVGLFGGGGDKKSSGSVQVSRPRTGDAARSQGRQDREVTTRARQRNAAAETNRNRKPVAGPSREESAGAATSRLAKLEDSERNRLKLRKRQTGKSVGQSNLEARLNYLRGQPSPG